MFWHHIFCMLFICQMGNAPQNRQHKYTHRDQLPIIILQSNSFKYTVDPRSNCVCIVSCMTHASIRIGNELMRIPNNACNGNTNNRNNTCILFGSSNKVGANVFFFLFCLKCVLNVCPGAFRKKSECKGERISC